MIEVGFLFHLFSFLLAMLAAVLLLWVNKEQKHSNRVLTWFLILCAFVNLNDAILYGGWFVKIPLLHKIVLPFTLLMTPLSYIYLRTVLLGELKFRPYDWLILIPFGLYTINLMPYYLMPMEKKRQHLVEFYNSIEMQGRFDEGILPAYLFNFLRVGWSAVFVFFNFRMIGSFKKQVSNKIVVENKELLNWLSLFNWIVTAVLLSAMVGAFLVTTHKFNLSATDIVLGIGVMVICIKLFLMPKLLYGIYLPSSSLDLVSASLVKNEQSIRDFLLQKEADTPTEATFRILQPDSVRYKKELEDFFQQKQPFLDVTYSLEKLSSDLNIPRHVLSAFINKEYGVGYREFLNRNRVNYIIANRFNPEWKFLTLEAIGVQAGFQNRTTFIRQFKLITGTTPSAYLKNTEATD